MCSDPEGDKREDEDKGNAPPARQVADACLGDEVSQCVPGARVAGEFDDPEDHDGCKEVAVVSTDAVAKGLKQCDAGLVGAKRDSERLEFTFGALVPEHGVITKRWSHKEAIQEAHMMSPEVVHLIATSLHEREQRDKKEGKEERRVCACLFSKAEGDNACGGDNRPVRGDIQTFSPDISVHNGGTIKVNNCGGV